MAWLVSRPLMQHDRGVFLLGIGLGLAWDALFEPVIGPGGIAWSAAALTIQAAAHVLVDRSPRAWAGLGAAATLVSLVVRKLALMPLGISADIWTLASLRTCLMTALWCGIVGWTLGLDLNARWQDYRSRRLR